MTIPDRVRTNVTLEYAEAAEPVRLTEQAAPTPGHPAHCGCGECRFQRCRALAQSADGHPRCQSCAAILPASETRAGYTTCEHCDKENRTP